MAETEIPDWPRGITFEQVWAGFMEDRKQMEEFRKRQEERDRVFSERMEETRKQMKRTDKRVGDLMNRFGEIAECLVLPGIRKRFNELGYHFENTTGNVKIFGSDGNIRTELDASLENSEIVIVVEVKTTPRVKDIDHHIKRIEIFREYRNKLRPDEHKSILGAIAGAVFGKEEKAAVIEAGMYVIEQSGDTMKIDVPADFIPRKW